MGAVRGERAAEVAALRIGLDHGLTHIDTAEMYGDGGAEETVAAAIRDRRRADLFIVSKVLPENASYRGTRRAAELSLRRLGTDYLDLYVLHWRARQPLGETMRAMEDLVVAGTIRFLGVSNFDVADLEDAMAALRRERLACNQVLYNLRQRGIERDLIPFCRRHGIAVVGYTPYGGFPSSDSGAIQVLAGIGRTHGCSARQVALAFLTRAEGVFAIPKASTVEHVRENAGAGDLRLEESECEAIDEVFPAPPRRVPLVMG